jgi:L-aspartate oxidase
MTEHDLQEVYLDLRPIGEEKIAEKFPNLVKTLSQYGIDALRQPVPVAPSAHYMMGGIEATVSGRTTVPGLYAIGECACTGLHGASRLASNSLLEAGVMALSLADLLAAGRSRGLARREARRSADRRTGSERSVFPPNIDDFRMQMYRHAGLVRSQAGLTGLLNTPICKADGELSIEHYRSRNIFQVGMLIARAALARQESRGAHLREDFSAIDEHNFSRHLWLSNEGQGREKSMAMLYH